MMVTGVLTLGNIQKMKSYNKESNKILEESLKEQRDALFQELEVGSILEGRVKNITDFGVFVDLGGIDGLLHITDLSWGRINHPSDRLSIGETITVKVIDFDVEIKQLYVDLMTCDLFLE